MTTIKIVLIAWMFNGGVAFQEFENMDACQKAKAWIIAQSNYGSTKAECVRDTKGEAQ